MAEVYIPLGGPVAVDKMEAVQLRNKAGRIRKTRPRGTGIKIAQVGLPEPTRKAWIQNLDVHGNVS